MTASVVFRQLNIESREDLHKAIFNICNAVYKRFGIGCNVKFIEPRVVVKIENKYYNHFYPEFETGSEIISTKTHEGSKITFEVSAAILLILQHCPLNCPIKTVHGTESRSYRICK